MTDPRDADLGDEGRFQAAAAKLIEGLFVILKVALVHRMDNKAVEPVAGRFRLALEGFQKIVSDEAAVQFVSDAVYVNRRLVRADLATWEKARFLEKFLSRMEVGEIAFHGHVPEQSVREFVQAVRDVALAPATADALHLRRFQGISFRKLEAQSVGQNDDALVLPDRFRVLRAYGIVIATLSGLLQALQGGKPAPLVQVRRALQEFVRLPPTTRPLQLGLLSLEPYRGQLAGRLAHIAITVMLMGKRLGLAVGEVRDMGVAAALSGIGRATTAELVFATPDRCAQYDAYCEGARWLVPWAGRGNAAALRLIATVEQSTARTRKGGHPLSRLIAIADAYDLLTQHPPHGAGLPAAAALERLVEAPDVDHSAARLLVWTLGLFPVGSTVKLTSGETGIVVDVTDDVRRLAEPRVMIVSGPDGAPVERRVVDLIGSGIRIVGTVDPTQIDLNVGHFLFA